MRFELRLRFEQRIVDTVVKQVSLILPPYSRTQPIRNVAPVVQAERGAFAQLVAA